MKTSQDLLDVERRIRITEGVRLRQIQKPLADAAKQAEVVGVHDFTLRLLRDRKAQIKAEIGALPDLPAPVYEPAPTDVSGWEDFK